MAWTLIGAGIVAFVVAGDVRTNWVVGDIGPEPMNTVTFLLALAMAP